MLTDLIIQPLLRRSSSKIKKRIRAKYEKRNT